MRHPSIRTVAALAVAAALALGAGPALGAPAPTKVKVCKLVKLADLEAAVGNPLLKGANDIATVLEEGACSYESPDPEDTSLRISVSTKANKSNIPGVDPFGTQESFDIAFSPSEEVSGVGKKAYFHFDTVVIAQAAMLAVDGKYAAQVVLTGFNLTEEAGRAATETIAKLALKQLKRK